MSTLTSSTRPPSTTSTSDRKAPLPVTEPFSTPPPARILVVCTANICRSPMAEVLLSAYLERALPDSPRPLISSAGTHARPDEPAAPGMVKIATRWRLDLSRHRSRPLDASLVGSQDLVLTMEDRHRRAVARLFPGITQRTFLLTEFAALLDVANGRAPAPDLRTLVRHLQQRRARLTVDEVDIPDPYGGPSEGYKTAAWQLAEIAEHIGGGLARLIA